MIIAIDGPAGSGKSTTAREVAGRLGFLHLDSGALYRAYAYVALEYYRVDQAGELDERTLDQLAAAPVSAGIGDAGVRVSLAGEELGAELRTAEVSAAASRIATLPAIRRKVNELLRGLAEGYSGGVVCEGRDMGTVVFPEAALKVYMKADPEVRAFRRLAQLGEPINSGAIRAETERLLARDEADSRRAISPLRPAPDAEVIDTGGLEFEEQVAEIVELARKRLDIP